MSRITVINKHHYKPKQPNTLRVYIGRPNAQEPGAPLGNPFEIGRDGNREGVIAKYRDWLPHQAGRIVTSLNNIRDYMKLGFDVELECYCAPQACHGDVIKERLQPKITFAVVDPPAPQPPENCKGHHRWVPVPTTHGVEPPKDQVQCEICWFIPEVASWPGLMKEFHRRLAVEQLMEYWHDLSDDEQHDWALDWLERSTDEELNSDCRNAFSDQ